MRGALLKKYNLIVVGGGYAGCAAAVSAARQGLKVLLIEKGNCLGGAAVNCLVNPYMPAATKLNGEHFELSQGIFNEILDNLSKYNAVTGRRTFNEEFVKIVLNDMVLSSGAEILFHTFLVDATCTYGIVNSITVANKAGLTKLQADMFIDCTGDADLAYRAGFSCRLGREEDGLCQPMTLCFRIANIDLSKYHEDRKEINRVYNEYKAAGKITNPREDVLIFPTLIDGVLHFNATRIVKLNPVDPFDVTKAEIEARKQALKIFYMLKDNIEGFENCQLLMTAADIGVRESRMINGEYLLTGDDLVACTKFYDSIALGNYDIDIHNPLGSGTSHYYFKSGEYYTIPYRSLIPKGAKNLLVSGRCISVDHQAQASIRILPIVTCLGQAAGLAAAIAHNTKNDVKNININTLHNLLSEAKAVF